jgi:micrococcal nuclease
MSQTQKTNKSKKAKWAPIVIAAAIFIFAAILLSKYGSESTSPATSADNPLPTVLAVQTTTQTTQTTASPQPTQTASAQTDYSSFFGPYDVVYVLDGDTIIADIDGDHIKIRLIGIDSPESVHYNDSENTAAGSLASDFAKSLLVNNQVWLEYDIEQFDQYGRTLAYVYTKQHGMINDYMLRNGYADVVTYPPNIKYAVLFAKSAEDAKKSNLGLWTK